MGDADIVIIGAWKCGSTSMEAFMKKTNPDKEVSRVELFHLPDNKIELHNFKEDAVYYAILRSDKANYYHSLHEFFYPQLKFSEFMALKNVLKTNMSAMELGDWDKHIARWQKKVKHFVSVRLENMQRLEGFPHLRNSKK